MKIIRNSLFRALCAILIGVLLIMYRDPAQTAAKWLLIVIGAIFLVSGIISCATYWGLKKNIREDGAVKADTHSDTDVTPTENTTAEESAKAAAATAKQSNTRFPGGLLFVGIGSVILGIILMVMPNSFIMGLMYVLAAITILGTINMFVILARATRFARIGLFFWLMPALLLLIAIYMIVHPLETVSQTQFVIGWMILVYGVVECMNTIKIFQSHRKYVRQQRQTAEQNAGEHNDQRNTQAQERERPESETPHSTTDDGSNS